MSAFRYLAVEWRHNHADEPIRLFSEVDSAGWEKRKVEEFRDGRKCYADSATRTGNTRLGDAVIPSIAEIAKDTQFSPKEISKQEFDQVWFEAKRS